MQVADDPHATDNPPVLCPQRIQIDGEDGVDFYDLVHPSSSVLDDTVSDVARRETIRDLEGTHPPTRFEFIDVELNSIDAMTTSSDDDSAGYNAESGEIPSSDDELYGIWSCMNTSVGVHYFAGGVTQSIIVGAMFSEMKGVMGVSDDTYRTCGTMIATPWGLCALAGFLSDVFPVGGYRRKSWAVIGWILVIAGMLLGVFGYAEPVPYYCIESGRYTKDICNPDAREHVNVFVAALVLSTIGLVVADGAANGLMVESCRWDRMGVSNWGDRLLFDMKFVQTIGQVLGYTMTGAFLWSDIHLGAGPPGGWAPGMRPLLSTVCALSVIMVGLWSGWCSMDRKTSLVVRSGNSTFQTISLMATSAQNSVVVILKLVGMPGVAKMIIGVTVLSMSVSLTPRIDKPSDVNADFSNGSIWVISAILGSVVYAVLLLGLGTRAAVRQVRWGSLVGGCVIPFAAMSTITHILVVMDVVSSPWFNLVRDTGDRMTSIPAHLIAAMCAVQIAQRGEEATVYGLMVSLPWPATIVGSAVGNLFYWNFPVFVTRDPDMRGSLTGNDPNDRGNTELMAVSASAVACGSMFVLIGVWAVMCLLPRGRRMARASADGVTHASITWRSSIACIACIGAATVGVYTTGVTSLPDASCLPTLAGTRCGPVI